MALILVAVVLLTGATALVRLWLFGGMERMASEKIGLVRVEGMITSSEDVVDWIARLARDDTVKGVVVRVNSPGGVVAPSQEIFRAVRRLSKEKPTAVSMASVAASGGYYVACGGSRVFANPGSLTGSIGVKAELPDIKGLLDKLGVSMRVIASGPYKTAGSPYESLTDRQREMLTRMVMDIHDQFVGDVSEARGMERGEVEKLARGQAYTGRQAKELGLVDQLGGLRDAAAWVRSQAQVGPGVPVLKGPPEESAGLLRRILGELSLELSEGGGLRLTAR
ncbi:signal peptide peptidase SppA [Desulfohalovibrio reitneri]|uniref:signal peptide peptidase SppA n=1 Tax=Desulfohalovibrio reitneri TaxID=1307759 RepID=UPI001F02F921|nr:signal peptide peptidase SppA [Desulfohalovibrio reitneri]